MTYCEMYKQQKSGCSGCPNRYVCEDSTFEDAHKRAAELEKAKSDKQFLHEIKQGMQKIIDIATGYDNILQNQTGDFDFPNFFDALDSLNAENIKLTCKASEKLTQI